MENIEQLKVKACIRILEKEKEECVNPEIKSVLNFCILAINKLDENKPLNIKSGCPHCRFIETLGDIQSNREYWIITEIFVHLHNGKDYCDWEKNMGEKKELSKAQIVKMVIDGLSPEDKAEFVELIRQDMIKENKHPVNNKIELQVG